jgi:bifunctional oligoribonuclease and PAP phosphatase NrnA
MSDILGIIKCMNKKEKLLKKEILKANKILILSHKGPDIDAFCSMLIVYKTLSDVFPEKDIVVKARQYPNVKLPQMKAIQIVQEEESIVPEDEDLIIVTDASEWKLCLEKEDTIQESSATTFFVDHHKSDVNNPDNTHTINEIRSSATEQAYVTFKKMFGKKFEVGEDIASLVQYGIISDTGRFMFDLTTPDTFRIFAEVMEIHRIDIEKFEYNAKKFPKEATDVIIEYLKTLTIEGDMSYMYISKELIKERGFEKQAVNEAYAFLKDKYLRFIQGVHWGFIVKPMFSEDEKWSVSFRSTKDYQDVEEIANKLNGGGHRYASATKIQADNVNEVLDSVLRTIEEATSA